MTLIKSVSGVRGRVRAGNSADVTMSADVAHRMGRAYATYVAKNNVGQERLTLVGGRDGRIGGDELLAAFADGARRSGVNVVDLAVVSTPGVAMMVQELDADGGVVITASHNPAEWNGIKLMTRAGRAPTRDAAEAVFNIFDNGDFRDAPAEPVRREMTIDPHEHHVAAVLRTLDVERIRRRSFSVLLDSINGAGAAAGRLLLERLGCRINHVNAEPAATFAHTPEPVAENLTQTCRQTAEARADVGLVQDPDADRLAIIDQNGRFIGEEYTLALCAKRVFATRPGLAATNLSTSRLIDDIAAAAGNDCRVVRSAVGEANVVDAMTSHACVFGGEGNGGVIDPRVVYVRDSLVAIGLTLDLLAAEDRTISELVDATPGYAMIKDKLPCDSERIAAVLASVRSRFSHGVVNDIDGVRVDWPDEKKWLHVRGSNTEPIVRIITEAADEQASKTLMTAVRRIVDETLA